jgi:hypothetical protein
VENLIGIYNKITNYLILGPPLFSEGALPLPIGELWRNYMKSSWFDEWCVMQGILQMYKSAFEGTPKSQ